MYAFCYGECAVCNRAFSFNPVRVPSVRVNGVREPVCLACVEASNPRRVANGLAPIVPAPDAYEACHESELS
jgi:hypothetical protein